ncbi:MAG: hypothetical protein M1821_009209 [Bathelium mastoideum]|nr:MAG: hypothetical protein M1821_009209 [Bathelium mastoideum]
MDTKPFARVWRVQCIPNGCSHYNLRCAFKDIFGRASCSSDNPKIYSLAINYLTFNPTQVATIAFEKEPEALHGDGNEIYFDVCFGYPGYHGTTQLVFDTNFEGLTPLRSFWSESQHTVDIIAVPGLGGHAFGSFKVRGGEYMWLRDQLPNDLENAQIYLYGYDSHLVESDSFQDIHILAVGLRTSISRLKDFPPRPILFIAHSLGGLLVKQAIVQLKEMKRKSRAYQSIHSGLFFGVPNKGMDIRSLRTIVKGRPNERLLTQLSPASSLLKQLSSDFEVVSRDLHMQNISFFETKLSPTAIQSSEWKMAGPPVILVDPSSATNESQSNRTYSRASPIHCNHSELVKLKKNDQAYEEICELLRQHSEEAPRAVKKRFFTQSIAAVESSPPRLVHPGRSRNFSTARFHCDGDTSLHTAVRSDDAELVASLVHFGAEINATNKTGMSPLTLAVALGRLNVARVLLNLKADLNAVKIKTGTTVLHYAAWSGEAEIVQILRDPGATVDLQDHIGRTPLHYAADCGYAKVVALLLDMGANPNIKTNVGFSPVQLAIWADSKSLTAHMDERIKTIKALVSHGADLSVRSPGKERRSCLFMAVERHSRADLIRVLRDARPEDIDVCPRNKVNWTPLFEASQRGKTEIMTLLLEGGANVNAQTSKGETPLNVAVEHGALNAVKLLLRYNPRLIGPSTELVHFAEYWARTARGRSDESARKEILLRIKAKASGSRSF